MILKDKQLVNANSPTSIAGQQQEQDVAFYLRRAFKDHEQVLVINDFGFSHNEENAQIDHLIIYPFGFILIESKSISGEVKVNKHGEWTRSVGQKWTGMASPIKQVELQQKLFREYLFEHRASILPKLFGIRQQSFGMRCWHNLCAVSSNAIIERESMPQAISNQIVKSEFLVDKVNNIMNLKGKVLSTLTFDTRPDFSNSELSSIASFLLDSMQPTHDPKTQDASPTNNALKSRIACKKCGESNNLSAQYGRYGYYVSCSTCETNTSMKIPCPQCQSANTKVAKRKAIYSLNCFDCSNSTILLETG